MLTTTLTVTADELNKVKTTRESLEAHIAKNSNPHGVTQTQVGLGKVNNTADLDKPVSTATQTALNTKVDKVNNMGLSDKNFTEAEKTKLEEIQAGAQVNLPVDQAVTQGGANAVRGSAVYAAIQDAKAYTDSQIETVRFPEEYAGIPDGETIAIDPVTAFLRVSVPVMSRIEAAEGSIAGLTNGLTTVSGVKGDLESAYRKGNVNITPANIGAQKTISGGTAAPSGGTDGDIYIQY